MKAIVWSAVFVAGLLAPAHLCAQDKKVFEVTKLADHLYELSTDGGGYPEKVVASVGSDGVLAGYASYESSYVKRPEWIEYWYSAYTTTRSDKPRPYAPVIRALQEKGAAAAMEAYGELRRTRPNDYWFEDQALMFMGRRLFRMKRFDDATVFLERCIKEFPGSEGAAVSHSVLASVCEQQGDLAKARLHLMTYLEKHPQDAAARKKLVEIEDRLKK